jgi:outer membrane protein assembly factor BamE (lipoprotein component of BamABCDE complex)
MGSGIMILGLKENQPVLLYAVFFILLIGVSLLFTAGCTKLNAGYDFPSDQVKNIQIGKTTKEEIRTTFGEPWRIGLENGLETWTYGKYKYRGFTETEAKDLVVRFSAKDIVESYTFSTTNR